MIDPISILLHKGAGKQGPVMLMYHSICQGIPDWPWAVSLHQFRTHLDFLASEGWATITMGQLVAHPNQQTERTVIITFDDGYVDNLLAFDELQRRGMSASWFVVTGALGQTPDWNDNDLPKGRLLNPSELRAMQAAGMEIGSHTRSHLRLTEVDDTRLTSELQTSKTELEEILGSEASSFAYPYGAWDQRCEQAVQRAGYKCACTTQTGWALRDNNPYSLRRLTVFNTDTASNLARMLALGMNHASWPEVGRYWFSRLQRRTSRGGV